MYGDAPGSPERDPTPRRIPSPPLQVPCFLSGAGAHDIIDLLF